MSIATMQFTITAWHRVLDPFQAARLLVQVKLPSPPP